jgi:creatinine amidohydrolase
MSLATTKLAELTTGELATVCATPAATVLLPVGSVEPHGPHLPLGTDTLISEVACAHAVSELRARGVAAYIAPSVPYGVTDFADGFTGAISVPAETLTAFLVAIARRFLEDGFAHICIVNNHLEPAHDAAVRAVAKAFPALRISVACPLTRRWGRTLSDEFKRGDCHAGRYETSLVLAAGGAVREGFRKLAPLDVSLADGIKAGKTTFRAMGLDAAYTGAPALASELEGQELFERLADMVVAEVTEALEGQNRIR